MVRETYPIPPGYRMLQDAETIKPGDKAWIEGIGFETIKPGAGLFHTLPDRTGVCIIRAYPLKTLTVGKLKDILEEYCPDAVIGLVHNRPERLTEIDLVIHLPPNVLVTLYTFKPDEEGRDGG